MRLHSFNPTHAYCHLLVLRKNLGGCIQKFIHLIKLHSLFQNKNLEFIMMYKIPDWERPLNSRLVLELLLSVRIVGRIYEQVLVVSYCMIYGNKSRVQATTLQPCHYQMQCYQHMSTVLKYNYAWTNLTQPCHRSWGYVSLTLVCLSFGAVTELEFTCNCIFHDVYL